ncbi:MAG: chorismate mutase [candidate division Zixibacteria bacterium]|nr:chorismate mutase [candidate division Zixibacteria bacterium]
MMRGIRGAICAQTNTRLGVLQATTTLLALMLKENEVQTDQIASIFLTATPDLNADYPAYGARELGLTHVPLLCATEIDVPGAMPRVIRILVHFETGKKQNEIRHIYHGEAARLRPDLAREEQP